MVRVLKGILGVGAALVLQFEGAKAATVQWGVNGAGGSGAWNSSNWWNGTSSAAWSTGNIAVFGGTAGTVSTVYPGPSVSGLVFNTAGYSIEGGYLMASGPTLSITTNANARITSTLSGSGFSNTLLKSGAGKLTLGGTNFIDVVQVNQGELVVEGYSSLFFSDVSLGNASDVIVTLASTFDSTSMGSLSGGGASGGIVRPDAVARTLSLTLFGGGTFGGVLADNGPGKLAIDMFSASGTQILQGVNTYSGATSVSSGTLIFSGAGSALNTASVEVDSTLRIDNTSVVKNDRLADSVAVTLSSGKLEFVGNSTQAVHETLGDLVLKAANQIDVSRPGAFGASMSFANIVRSRGATLNVTGAPGISIGGLVSSGSGLLPTYIISGQEWSKLDGQGEIVAATDYSTNINAAGDSVKLTTSAMLNASISHRRLNVQGTGTLDLGGHTLGLTEGGLLTSGGSFAITNGVIDAGLEEVMIINDRDLSINARISGGSLSKSGAGLLTLSGDNSYSGPTTITQGVLQVSSERNLGTGDTIYFGGGELRASGNFVSSKNIARTTSFVAVINTNGYDLTFSGEADSLQKRGEGTLILADKDIHLVSMTGGTLILSPDVNMGTISLNEGTLIVAGRVGSLELSGGTLDIGGVGAETLTAGSLRSVGSFMGSSVTIKFGLGAETSDLLVIDGSVVGFTTDLLFDFSNLGGAQAGVDYLLIELGSLGPQPTWNAQISQNSINNGWEGVFSNTLDGLTVRFTAVPEPSTWMLIGVAAVGLGWRRMRRG